LGVLWAGLEPTQGEYNITYLEEVAKIVNLAGENGLWPVLDMHQDVFNRKYCGNGVPDWVAQPDKENFPYPLEVEYETDENHYPSREDCDSIPWVNYHFTTSLAQAYGRLYNNFRGLLDNFAEFWGKVAETFAGNEDVLGYEIMNEPWCGDVYEDPTLLMPGIADRRYLQPMYDRVNDEIRKHDDEHIILFESVTWEITGIGEAIGFTHPPGGDDYRNRSVLSFHNSVQEQVTSHEDYYDLRWGEIQRLGIAGFVTETGDCCLDLADEMTKWGYSWHHWAYKLYGAWTWDSHGLWNLEDDNNYNCPDVESCLNKDRVRVFARTYAQSIAGDGKYFHFNSETSEAVLVFQPNPSITEPTELRVPISWRYSEGVKVDISPSGVADYNFLCCGQVENTTLQISLTEMWNGEEISVAVMPL